MNNFFTAFILTDPRAKYNSRISDINMLEPITRYAVNNIIDEARKMGFELMVFETYRSQERQQELYNDGKSQLRKVGVHHYGLACDIVKVIDGQPSWDGNFDFLGKLARKHGLIWGGDWGNPARKHDFIDSDHVQRCSIGRQESLFDGAWYPDDNYNPYNDSGVSPVSDLIPEGALSIPEVQHSQLSVNLKEHTNYEGERLDKLNQALTKM